MTREDPSAENRKNLPRQYRRTNGNVILLDSSVVRCFAVIGWIPHLLRLLGGTIFVADEVHSHHPDGCSELRRIRDGIQRDANREWQGSGTTSRALAAICGFDALFRLDPTRLVVLTPTKEEWIFAGHLTDGKLRPYELLEPLKGKTPELGGGESMSISIARSRGFSFASDDNAALNVWRSLTGQQGMRTLNLFQGLVAKGIIAEIDARTEYERLREDSLHRFGGPAWESVPLLSETTRSQDSSEQPSVAGDIADGLLIDSSDLPLGDGLTNAEFTGLNLVLGRILEPGPEGNVASFNSSI
jgi:hypothetical protein